MILCDLCSTLKIKSLYPPNIYYHGQSLTAVEETGKTCQLCELISLCIWRNVEQEGRPKLYFEGAALEAVPYDQTEERNRCSIKLQILDHASHAEQIPSEIRHIGIWMKSIYMVSDITLSVEEGDMLGTEALTVDDKKCFIAGRVLASERPNKAYFDVARLWLHDCQKHHSEYAVSASAPPQLPTRVIEVGPTGQDPRLVDGDGRAGNYATLSHCWGRSPTVKTEMENLRLHKEHIVFDALPKTFRETIEVCRELGIPYLWIDSLCIIQDSKGDWEYHSSIMGSIFYDSTITLAATDAHDSSIGLYIPKKVNQENPSFGLVPLPKSFGSGRGQAYATTSSWGAYGPPMTNVDVGILQSRGWVMQEKYLSRRTIHFLQGQMAWECSKMARGQGGFVEEPPIWNLNLRTPLKTFCRTFERPYICPWLDDDIDSEDGEEEKEETIVDLRHEAHRDGAQPILLDHSKDEALCKFINEAVNSTIYHVWYEAVSSYSTRRLTFAHDKLPALAGITSRVYDITKDDYLAGHWRRELERSLFWRVETESNSGHPGRVKVYRAPSWSWASVNASTIFDFAEMNSGHDTQTTVEILDAQVEVDGKNPFGCVKSGKITMNADVIRAEWQATTKSWLLKGTGEACEESQFDDLLFTDSADTIVGLWKYDDIVHGVMPGLPLTEDTPLEEAQQRSVPSGYFGAVHWSNMRTYGEDANDSSTLWKRATYVPEELVLVKGTTTHQGGDERPEYVTQVLVLARTEGQQDEYRRVGIGSLATWLEDVASREVLRVV